MNDIRKERMMISIITIGGLASILLNYFAGWEFWVPVIAVTGLGSLWWLHITGKLDHNSRIMIAFIYSAFTVFYHGVHDASLYDISVVFTVFLAIFSLSERIVLLTFILVEYSVVMGIQIIVLFYNGQYYRTGYTIFRIFAHVGAVLIMYFFSRMIVASRLSEREGIRRWQESARGNDFDMQDFLTNISHELRTPVNVISGMTAILKKKHDDEELDNIDDAGQMLVRQIEDIRDFTEIKRKEVILEEENYHSILLTNDLISDFQRMQRTKDTELIVKFAPDMPSMLTGDIEKLHKIIRHLLDNAVKFTKKGKIVVEVKSSPQDYGINLIVEVSDSGIGMTRSDMAHVSRGMYQANRKRTRSSGGIGLGLPIVYGFVHKMGGFVMINSEIGLGTTVRISIPQAVADPTPVGTEEMEVKVMEEKPYFEGVRALIVDDEPMNLVVASGLLEDYGIKTETAESGKEAIGKYEEGQYDIIFMDHMMPEMDGVEAMKKIRKAAPEKDRKVIMVALTANVLGSSKEMFRKEGFDGFVAKPIDIKALEHVLKNLLPEKMKAEAGRDAQ